MADDKLVKLLFLDKNCHAEVLHLGECWQNIIRNQHLPVPVAHMLGELTCVALMLAVNLKFKGSVILQIQGDGPVRLALVEVHDGLTVRATAQMNVKAEEVPENATFKDLVNAHGNGRCAMILDAADRAAGEQPYQSVVPLTGLWLAAGETSAGGILLQHVANTGGKGGDSEKTPEETLAEITVYADTVTREELLNDDAMTLARHLFWELNPTVSKELKPKFQCRCSMAGIRSIVKSLGKDEAESIIKERGTIEVTCSFCGAKYVMDAIDVEALFHTQTVTPPTTSQPQ